MRLCVLMILGNTLLAQEQFSIDGNVLNAVTGAPVRRAEVQLQALTAPAAGEPVSRAASADAAGHFSFEHLPAGTYAVGAQWRGFLPPQPPQQLIQLGPSRPGLAIRLIPMAAITGKVADENGDPMAGVLIQVLRSAVRQGRRSLEPASGATTNDIGEYRAASLPPGTYFVSAAISGLGRGRFQLQDGAAYPRVYYSASQELGGAAPIPLTAGAEARADFQMVPAQGHRVSGTVMNPGDRVFVSAARHDGGPSFGAGQTVEFNRQTGRFEIRGLTPGSYRITATNAQTSGVQVSASQDVNVGDADVEDVTLTMGTGTRIPLNIRTDAGPAAVPVAVALLPTGGTVGSTSSRPGPDGLPVLNEVGPGTYSLQVTVPEPYYVRSALYGGDDALEHGVQVTDGGGGALDIVIGSNGGQVEGTVLAGDKAAPNTQVLLKARGSNSSAREKMARTDSAGHFRISGVAPGDYVAYAWGTDEEVEYGNPEVLKQYRGENVAVSEGGKQLVQVRLR